MKKKIETYMQNYDQKISEKIAKEKAMEEEAENDGWVTVTGRKKRGQFALSRKESTINKVQRKEEQKNKKKQLLNFYTFQIRESKRQSKFYVRLVLINICRILIFGILLNFFYRFSRVKEEVRIRQKEITRSKI